MDPIAISLFLFLILVFLGEVLLLITPVDICLDVARFDATTVFISMISFGALGFRTDYSAGSATNEMLIAGRRLYCFSGKRGDGALGKEGIIGTELGVRSRKYMIRHAPGLLQDVLILLGEIVSSFSIRSLELNIRLGFSSSALTGLAFGYYSALKAVITPLERLQITMTPVFGQEVMEGRALVLLRVRYPIRILFSIFRFLLGRRMRRFLLEMGKGDAS